MKLNSFEVAGYKFERVEGNGHVDRYDHLLENGDRLIVVNNQSATFKAKTHTRWTAFCVANDAVGRWVILKGPAGRARYFGTPDIAAGQALKEWAFK